MVTGKLLVVAGALSAGIGVALGAFGAHALRRVLDERMRAVWETAVQYHLVHALALVLVGLAAVRTGTQAGWATTGALLFAGQILFSGSLYLLALTGVRWLGAITPFGGLCFIAGWALLAWVALRTL